MLEELLADRPDVATARLPVLPLEAYRVLKKKFAWYEERVGRLMRYLQAEKMQIIQLVEASELPITRTLQELDVPRSSFYRWYQRYQEAGYGGLASKKLAPRQFWNRIPQSVRDHVVELALNRPVINARPQVRSGPLRSKY